MFLASENREKKLDTFFTFECAFSINLHCTIHAYYILQYKKNPSFFTKRC